MGWQCEEEARVGGFTWRDDDWEVTRLASLQPIRAEQIGYCWRFLFCCRYGIALGGDSDARHVTSQWEAHGGSDAWCGNVWVGAVRTPICKN